MYHSLPHLARLHVTGLEPSLRTIHICILSKCGLVTMDSVWIAANDYITGDFVSGNLRSLWGSYPLHHEAAGRVDSKSLFHAGVKVWHALSLCVRNMTCIGINMGCQLVTDTAVDIGMACDMVKKRTQGDPTGCII